MVRLPLNDSVTRLRLHVDFLTGRPGPLFSALGSVDFVHVEVTSGGRVVVGVELGAGRTTLSSPVAVSSVADRRWHSAAVVRPSDTELGRCVLSVFPALIVHSE